MRPAAAMACVLALVTASPTAGAREDRDEPGSSLDSIVTPEQSRAVRMGLQWIASKQQPGGKWGSEQDTQVADTALSLLALMAGGNTLGPGTPLRDNIVGEPTGRGEYASKVKQGLAYLARLAGSDAPPRPLGYIKDDVLSHMHGHGFATLALAQACGNLGAARIETIQERVRLGSSKDLSFADQVRWGLECAVRLTEMGQDKDTGGWGYQPDGTYHEGSMTVTQITALRAASAAGVSVNGTVMEKAYDYVRKSQNLKAKDLYGGFAYRTNDMNRVSLGLTSAAITTFFGLGRYGDKPGDRKIIDDAMSYIDRHFEDDASSTHLQWYYYRNFYLVQALYLSGDETRLRKYWPKIRDDILQRQNEDGSFPTRADQGRSDEYCTAMGVLILQVPMETLPIFQRR